MTWVSYDDDFTERPVWDGVSYEVRWHFMALVERCVRDRRWSGELPLSVGLRCSDVPDPATALEMLCELELISVTNAMVQVAIIEDFIPPPGQRPELLLPRKKANQQAYRQRRCDQGRHDPHCPKGCPARNGLPRGLPVTPGRDGTGRKALVKGQLQELDPWATAGAP